MFPADIIKFILDLKKKEPQMSVKFTLVYIIVQNTLSFKSNADNNFLRKMDEARKSVLCTIKT